MGLPARGVHRSRMRRVRNHSAGRGNQCHEGARVVVAGRREAQGLEVVPSIESAGGEALKATADHRRENWDAVITNNFTGVWLCMKHEIPALLTSGAVCPDWTHSEMVDPALAALPAVFDSILVDSRQRAR